MLPTLHQVNESSLNCTITNGTYMHTYSILSHWIKATEDACHVKRYGQEDQDSQAHVQ